MKRRYILAKPPRSGIGLLDGHGRGGPGDPQRVPAPGLQPNAPGPGSGPQRLPAPGLLDPTKAISDALGSAVQKFVQDILPAGEVLLGAVLVVVGLLLATGLAGKGAKVGAIVATRGAIK